MDLGTVKNHLHSGYYRSHEEFAADVRQVFINCALYNAVSLFCEALHLDGRCALTPSARRTPRTKSVTWATHLPKRSSRSTPSSCAKSVSRRCARVKRSFCRRICGDVSRLFRCCQEMEERGELLASDDTPQFLVKWKRKATPCVLTGVRFPPRFGLSLHPQSRRTRKRRGNPQMNLKMKLLRTSTGPLGCLPSPLNFGLFARWIGSRSRRFARFQPQSSAAGPETCHENVPCLLSRGVLLSSIGSL
jgi:hypothetical protein